MVAAIVLTAGLVLVFGDAEQNRPPRSVDAFGAAQTTSSTAAPSTTAPTDSTTGSAVELVDDLMEVLGSELYVSVTTTTFESTTTSTTPARATTTTTRPQSPPSTSGPTTTTTTVPATTTTTIPGSFQADMEAEFLVAINSLRTANGLSPLQRDSSLDSRARDWSKRMADRNKLSHSNLSSLLGPWSAAGENVGRGGSVESLFNALNNSSGHRANMLGDFTHVGIGLWRAGNGTLWTTHVFAR